MPCAPSGTRILPRRPSSTASNSIVALSVSISASTSPECTSSPSLFSHFVTLPSVMVGDSAGIRISIGMLLPPPTRPPTSAVGNLMGRGDEVLHLRHREALGCAVRRQRNIFAGAPLRRRVEPVEALLHHDC